MAKQKSGFLGILILLVLVGGGIYYFRDKLNLELNLDLFAVSGPPVGGKDGGTNIWDNSSTYTCSVGGGGTGDSCDVEGVVQNMNISSGILNNVVFRTNAVSYDNFNDDGVWIVLDCVPSGNKQCVQSTSLNGYCRTTSTITSSICTNEIYTLDKTTSFYNPIIVRSSYLYIYTDGYCRKYTPCSDADLTLNPKEPYTSNNQEMVDGTTTSYKLDWNFCPAGDDAFSYCNGANAETNSNYPISATTEKVRLTEGQSISFTPKDINGNQLPQDKFYMRIQKWDMTCAGEYPNKCNSDQTYCLGPGYCIKCRYYSAQSTPFLSSSCQYGCEVPTTNYYKTCTGIDANGCSIWGTASSTCTSGKCYVGTQAIQGVGSCKCDPSQCTLNTRRASELGGDYDLCIIGSGGCNEWQSRTCVNGLTFDLSLLKCINTPNDAECSSYTPYSECQDNTKYTCTSNGILDERNNYRWYLKEDRICTSPYSCVESGNTANCACDCTQNSIRCTSSTTKYERCLSAICWTETNIPDGMKCENNQIVPRTDIGCAYNTAGYECDTTNKQVCKDNSCQCIQDIYTAQESDLLTKKCFGNDVYNVVKYQGTKTPLCYRWEKENTCTGGDTCLNGQCMPPYQYVGVIPKSEYAIGEKIEGIDVDVTSNFQGGNSNVNIISQLFEGIAFLSRYDTYTDTNGKATLSFNYAHPREGSLVLKVTVGDLFGVHYNVTKDINVKKTLEIFLTCPIQANVERTIECSWNIKDKGAGTSIVASPIIKVTQGGIDIPYTAIGTNKLSFKSSTTGSLEVELTASKEGYISDTVKAVVGIIPLQTEYKFSMDNLDYYSYVSGYLSSGYMIDKGIHELRFNIEESGQPVAVQKIDAIMTTPSSQDVPLVFNKASIGNYKTTYNFEQPGQTYQLDGIIYLEDISKPNIPLTFSITTKGVGGATGTTADTCVGAECYMSYIIIGISVILALGVIGLLFRRKR